MFIEPQKGTKVTELDKNPKFFFGAFCAFLWLIHENI
jgi:hypothetical protein